MKLSHMPVGVFIDSTNTERGVRGGGPSKWGQESEGEGSGS